MKWRFPEATKRRHRWSLTIGVTAGAVCCIIGIHTGMMWLCYVGEATNLITAILWIWE